MADILSGTQNYILQDQNKHKLSYNFIIYIYEISNIGTYKNIYIITYIL
jgi:hypothetical protein